jgi:AbrB family looped-hinge helix DNA binding protein
MNAQTKLSAKGQVVIPKDVRDRLNLKPGTRFEVSERMGIIQLTPAIRANPFPPTTIEDLRKWPKYNGTPKTVEEISSLSDEALREIFAEQERNARG